MDKLYSKIYELYEEMLSESEMYFLYGGMLDNQFNILPKKEQINLKNVSPHEALVHLMKSYRPAIELKALCQIYDLTDIEKPINLNTSDLIKCCDKVIEAGGFFIKNRLRDLERKK